MLECWLALMLSAGAPAGATANAGAAKVYKDPYEAYKAKAYDQALQGFLDMQVEHPNDAALAMNVGSAYYQLKSYGEAERAFNQAAVSTNPELREQALYNLGNSAYQQGKLEDALERYKGALALNGNDIDARANLDYVRQELERRQKQAQKQQEQPPQQQPNDPNQQQQQQQAQNQQQQQQQGGQQQQQQQQGNQQKQQQDQQGKQPQPGKQQDHGKQQQADAGQGAKPDDSGQQNAAGAKGDPKAMTKQQAARYLDSLSENRPKMRPPDKANSTQQVRNGKDW